MMLGGDIYDISLIGFYNDTVSEEGNLRGSPTNYKHNVAAREDVVGMDVILHATAREDYL